MTLFMIAWLQNSVCLMSKMRFWKTESPDIVVTEDLILRSVSQCPLKSKSRARWKRDVKIVRGRTDRLWPYTSISAAVMVLNSARHGPSSAVVNFHTKQDGMLLELLICVCACWSRLFSLVLLPLVFWHCWLGIRKNILPVKDWVMRCWNGCLSGARCRWFAYDQADATATHSSRASLKYRMVLHFWCRLTQF